MTSEVGLRDPPGSPPPHQILDIDPEGVFLQLRLDSRCGGLDFKDSFTACTAAGAHCEGVKETTILFTSYGWKSLTTHLMISPRTKNNFVCLFVGCLTSQQHASVSQGRICTDNFTCCHTEIEAADQTFHLTQSQYTNTRPTSPSADPISPGVWQGSHWSANV